MKDQHNSSQAPAIHQVGDRVWLEGTHLRTQQLKAKLDAKRFGPFAISAKLGPITYRLDIPKTWKNARIHPVFHSSLLTPYVEMLEHGPSHTQPPPVIVQEGDEGDDAYKIEQVLNARPTRNRCGWEYLVKWLGYGDVENMWLKRSDMTTSAEAVGEYHAAHPNAPQPLDLDAWLGRNNAHPGVDAP
jgi:hypothetical protein